MGSHEERWMRLHWAEDEPEGEPCSRCGGEADWFRTLDDRVEHRMTGACQVCIDRERELEAEDEG